MLLGGLLRAGDVQYQGNKAMKSNAMQKYHMHVFINLLICVLF